MKVALLTIGLVLVSSLGISADAQSTNATATNSTSTNSTAVPEIDSLEILPAQIQYTTEECNALSNESGPHVTVCEYPFDITVNIDERVIWILPYVWDGIYHHTITSDDGLFDHRNTGSVSFLPGSYGVGVYPFHDANHPDLTGTITVVDLSAPAIETSIALVSGQSILTVEGIQFPSQSSVEVVVSDSLGDELLTSSSATTGEGSFDLPVGIDSLADGSYTLTVTVGSNVLSSIIQIDTSTPSPTVENTSTESTTTTTTGSSSSPSLFDPLIATDDTDFDLAVEAQIIILKAVIKELEALVTLLELL